MIYISFSSLSLEYKIYKGRDFFCLVCCCLTSINVDLELSGYKVFRSFSKVFGACLSKGVSQITSVRIVLKADSLIPE